MIEKPDKGWYLMIEPEWYAIGAVGLLYLCVTVSLLLLS